MTTCCGVRSERGSRRDFFRRVMAGAVAAGVAATPGLALAGHCDVLLVTCMDYRLQNEIQAYMDGRGLRDEYDHIVLAGASLGAVHEGHKTWAAVFWDHLDAAMQLHQIRKVMILDHRDCGAYRLFLGEAAVKTQEQELEIHALQLRRLAGQILAKHPELEVELGIMALDGTVTPVSVGGGRPVATASTAAHEPPQGHAAPPSSAQPTQPLAKRRRPASPPV